MSALEPWWTDADAAELAVLLFEVARGHDEHRERCEACDPEPCPILVAWEQHLVECPGCRGDAPLSYPACPGRRAEFIAHGATCAGCNPCPSVLLALRLVGEWREARELQSRAEWLRREEEDGSLVFLNTPGRVHVVFDDRGEVAEYALRPPAEEVA